MTRLRRVIARAGGLTPDALAIAGLAFVAYGLGQAPAPWGAILAPIALGVGLIATVRFGAR